MAEPFPSRATTLTTKRATLHAFRSTGSGRALGAMVAVAVMVRLLVGEWSLADAAIAAALLVALGPVEWVIHLVLLHASPEAWTTRVLGTSTGHRQHHLDPPAITFILLRGIDALVFGALLGGVSAAAALPVAWALGAGSISTAVTAVLMALLLLGHYEWTHLLVHTAYRPRTRYYARLARNHRRHHYRSEHYWLGVTSNLGDRIMRTLPAASADVPRSDTARTLSL
ncbi:MAG: sterol desaturase family protein [Ilumatobacteraceae bacterium]